MRKKWTYVAIVSMMLGVAPVFTGCVDTDEPAGLEQLRGAKAELLKAKAQVQLALAELEAANARYRDQETAWMKAKADYEAQVAREKELQNDLLEAKNEIEKQKAQAEYDAYLEEMARQKELLDAQLAVDLKNLEADMKQAEINLEVLRQELELAKVTGSEATQAAIAALQADVETAYVKLYGGYLTVTSTSTSTSSGIFGDQTTTTEKQEQKKVIGALPEYYYAKKAEQEALAYQNQGFDCRIEKNEETGVYTVTPITSGKDWAGTLDAYVKRADADYQAAKQLLADLETYGDKEVEGTDWKAEVEKLQAEIEKLNQDLSVQLAQLDQAHTTPAYLDALRAVEGTWKLDETFEPVDADADGIDDETGMVEGVDYREAGKVEGKTQYEVNVTKGALQVLEDTKKALKKAQRTAKLSFDAYEAKTEVTATMTSAMKDAAKELNDELPESTPNKDKYTVPSAFAYEAQKDFNWELENEKGKQVIATREDEPEAVEKVMTDLNKWITIVDKATIDPYTSGQAAAELKRKEADKKAAQDAYNGAVKNWEVLVGIVSEKKAHTVTSPKLTASVDTYNKAFGDLEKAIKGWNDAQTAAYDNAKKAGVDEWTFELQQAAMYDEATNVQGFNRTAFNTYWENLLKTDADLATSSQFRSKIDEYCGDGENAANISKEVWTGINAYVEYEMRVDATGREDQILKDAKDVLTNFANKNYFDKGSKYSKPLNDAKTALDKAVWNGTGEGDARVLPLTEAIAAFNEDAKAYAQVIANADMQVINRLIGIADKTTGKYSGFTSIKDSKYYNNDAKADATTGKTVYAINITDITTEEVGNATKTKYDEKNGENALRMESLGVFGMYQACYVEPSQKNIEDDIAEQGANKQLYQVDTDGDGILDTWVTYQKAYESSFAYALFEAEESLKATQDKIDAADDLKALSAELVAAKAALEKSIDEQYKAAFGELETAMATASDDLAKKQDALDAEDAKFNTIDVEIAKLQAQIKAENELLETLQKAAWQYLNITWPEDGMVEAGDQGAVSWAEPSGNYKPDEFVKQLQKAIDYQKLVVADKERIFALAQAEYDKAVATGYNGCDLASLYVQAADANVKTAQEAYTRALTALQNALDILSGSDATEQPAE